ncbi:MarR family transcriptional regulator [Alkalibacter rhizosphaerae]|uniref:MarR family transcriptional regulator n=1 Tax=Alkalibacter rhizosphaerae TaxID=2815577 RepID=A0A974XEL4_9FIRM|nr:MarR family transcriptional regulator [Alkalibacter rhizosphaerae]QSX08429.1 MarR family transcriptional regulator [Alkalibacter rhizosphaerae]
MFICDISVFNKYGKQMLDEKLQSLNMDWHEMVVLLVLEQIPGISQTRLVPFLQTDKANVTKILQGMEKKKQIHRELDANDHRNKVCRLTSKGSKLLPLLHDVMKDWESACFQDVTEEELISFQKVTKTITKNLMNEF